MAAHVVGDQWSAAAHRIRDLLSRNSVAFEFVAAGSEEGRLLLARAGAGTAALPVVVLFDGRVLADPDVADLAGALGCAPVRNPRGTTSR